MPNDARLSHDQVLELHAAALTARLADSRPALLTGIDNELAMTLERAASPADQILRDLDALNAAGTLLDGSAPLRVWLQNAVRLAGQRREAEVFRRALAQLPSPSGGTGGSRVSWLAGLGALVGGAALAWVAGHRADLVGGGHPSGGADAGDAEAAISPRLRFDLRLAGPEPLGLFVRNGGPGRATVRSIAFTAEAPPRPVTRDTWLVERVRLGIPDRRINHGWLDPNEVLASDAERPLLLLPREAPPDAALFARFQEALSQLRLEVCYCSLRGACQIATFPPSPRDDQDCTR